MKDGTDSSVRSIMRISLKMGLISEHFLNVDADIKDQFTDTVPSL